MRHDEEFLHDLHRATRPVRPPNPAVAVWRWRYELGALAGAAFAVPWVAGLHPALSLGLVGALAAGLAVPSVRRLGRVRVRGVVVQHRLRTAFVETRLHGPRGRVPTILWTRPRAGSDRVWLLLPAGVTPEAIAARGPEIAGACFADRVDVAPWRGRRHLVVLTITRG